MPKITTSATFWDNADKSGECWIWMRHIDKHGYGRWKTGYAHRYAYEAHAGRALKEGEQVDHKCHQRACINPKHLRAVTNKQNGENRAGPNRNNTSGVLGVHWNKRHERWCAQFKHNGRSIYVGMFYDLAEAEEAIKASRNKVFTCNTRDRIKKNRKAA